MLCQTYWYPLYAFVRRQGYDAEEAKDLTQEFFLRFLRGNYLKKVKPSLGRFRSYLLAAIKHFLANEWDRASAKKRGGGQVPLSLDFQDAEGRYRSEPSHQLTPEKIFQKRWALTLLESVLKRLREEYAQSGKERLFDCLKQYLIAENGRVSYREVAQRLNMSEAAVKVAVPRLRKRYRRLLRLEIAQTVADPSEIEDEIKELFAALQ